MKRIGLSIVLATGLVVVLATGLVGCGGSQVTVEHRLDDKHLGTIGPEARGPVADAFVAHWMAEKQLDRWRFERADARFELKLAKAEKSRAKADSKMASLRVERNKAAFLTGLAETARKAFGSSKGKVRAQNLKIEWLEARLRYLDKEIEAGAANVLATDAAFELAKANLAQKKGIKPKGFKAKAFSSQASKAKNAYQGKRKSADRAKASVKRKRSAWNSASK